MKKIFSFIFRKLIGANLLVLFTFLLLPILLITNDIDALQSAINFINKE